MWRRRRTSCIGLGGVVGAAVTATLVAGQPEPLFRSTTSLVSVFATVVDSQQRLVTDLVAEDFEILDNGRVQPIELFHNDVQPITVVVMLDTSASMTHELETLYEATEQFLIRLLPEDKGRVGAFNDKIEFAGGFTSDRDELVATLEDLDYGNATRLWDAVAASLDELKGIEGRRVILVFTDGEDTDSRIGLNDLVARARAEEVMVYAIGLETIYFDGVRTVRSRPARGLRRLTEETGGGFLELKRTTDLGRAFSRVAQELHSQYVLGFRPPELDGKVHKLTVRVKRPGTTARARRSYLAEGGSPDGSR